MDEKQLDKDARRTLKKNGIKDPSGMDVDMEPLGMHVFECRVFKKYDVAVREGASFLNDWRTFTPTGPKINSMFYRHLLQHAEYAEHGCGFTAHS